MTRADAERTEPDLPPAEEMGGVAGSIGGLLFAAGVLTLALTFFGKSLSIDSDAEVWPRTLSLILAVLAALQLVRELVARLRGTRPWPQPNRRDSLRRLATALWLLALCIAAPFTGFGIAALLFVPSYMLGAGVRSLPAIAIATALGVGLITFLFGTAMDVPIWEVGL